MCALGAVATLHGLVYVPFAGHRLGDTGSYVAAAQAIRHGGYSTPLATVDVTGLPIPLSARGSAQRETYRTPGYPLLLAATGGGGPGWPTDAVIAAQAVLAGATTVLLTLLARRLWNPTTALFVGAVSALDPFPKHYVTRILSESLASFLVVLVAYLFVRAWHERTAWWWAATGAATAALTLTRPLFVLALPVVVVSSLLVQGGARRRIANTAALVAAAAVLLAPWVAWTNAATGAPVLASFGEGWNLLIAAHGEGLYRTSVQIEASPAYRRDFRSVHRFAPSAAVLGRDPDAHPRYLHRADVEQQRLAVHLYRHRLRSEPLTVLGEITYRSYFLWQAHEDWAQPAWLLPVLRGLDWVTLALASFGIALSLRRGGPARALGVFLLVFTLASGLQHVEARYGIPLRSLYLTFAVVALLEISRSAKIGTKTPATRIGGVT